MNALWMRGTEMCSGAEAGSYVRLIDSCITQRKAQGTCNESNEEEKRMRGGAAGGDRRRGGARQRGALAIPREGVLNRPSIPSIRSLGLALTVLCLAAVALPARSQDDHHDDKVDSDHGDGQPRPRVEWALPDAEEGMMQESGSLVPPWRQPRGKSQVNLQQMPPDSGGICMGVD